MRIFVINLPDNSVRRESIERQLRSLSLDYEILPAVRGKSLSPEERQRDYDEKRSFRTFGRPLGAGELGCALSHIACYRKVVENNLPHALILEDDAWLNPNLPQLLKGIEQLYTADQPNVVLLSWAVEISQPYRRLWAGYGLQPVRSAQCAHAYTVTHAAAKSLLNALYPVHTVADYWDWIIKHRVADLKAVVPPCITSDLAYDSGIAPEMRKMIESWTWGYRITRKLSRVWWKSVDGIRAIANRFHRQLRSK